MLSQHLSFSRAAEELHISQPTLSRHMRELEAEMGMPLLRRTTHDVALTEAGRVLAKKCPEMIVRCDSALQRLRTRNLPARGVLRIGVGLELSYSCHLRTFAQGFLLRYPDIELQCDVFSATTLDAAMRAYDLYFTSCTFPDLPETTQRTLIRSNGTFAVLPPKHPLAEKPAVSLYQLAGQTLIVPHGEKPFGPYMRNQLLAEKATKGQISILRADNLATALFLVSMKKGICIAPWYAKNMLPPELSTVSISDRACCFDEYLYYNEKGNGAANLFFQEYKETLL